MSLVVVIVMVLCPAWGCGKKVNTTSFVNPDFNFAFVERIAVVPLENLSSDGQAGERSTRLLITELLATGAVDVVGPGEVRAALSRVAGSSKTPTTEQIIALGEALQVQAVLMGSVAQSETIRSGTANVPVVTLDVHMMETDTGKPVWAATASERGSTAGAKWLGVGGEPISETTRRCVRKIVKDLVK
jgi:hypothetical protein